MTSDIYLSKVSSITEVINGYNYINTISFKIDALSSKTVKFYKNDTSQNYTYPIINQNSVIQVSYS